MKKHTLILLRSVTFLFISVTVSHCDLLGKSDDTSLRERWPVYFSVDVNRSKPDSLSYSVTSEYDAANNPYVIRYRGKIKRFSIEKIGYEIGQYSGPAGVPFTNGTMKLTTSGKVIVSEELMKLQAIYGETELTSINSDGLKELNDELNSSRHVGVTVQGKLSSSNVSFGMNVYFHVVIITESL